MPLYWYAYISMNTNLYMMYDISLETVWWALSNTSSIVWIYLAVHKILANKTFTVTDGLISQLFVVTSVHPTYVQIVIIWSFPVQLSLWKYKLNEICNSDFLLLKFLFLAISNFSCYFISAFNLSSNSATTSFVFSKSSSFFQVLYSVINLFYHTKYFTTSRIFLLFQIFSTSHFSTPSTFIGFASSTFYPFTYSLYYTI